MTAPGYPGLELREDLDFQRRAWRARRVVFAAMAGAFGSGPLARGVVEAGGLRLDYERLARYQTPATLRIELRARPGDAAETRLWLDRGWVERVSLRQITPSPARAETADDRVVLVVRLGSGSRRAAVTVDYVPETMGRLPGRIGVEGAPPLGFTQWVYP